MSSFQEEVTERIKHNGNNKKLLEAAQTFTDASILPKYSYNFSWLGRPIIQYPQDMLALQELIWTIKPDLIFETGIAHGGSLIFYASLLELNAMCGGPDDAQVVGVDIDIRKHNREQIEAHPMYKRIEMIEGSSIDPDIVNQISQKASTKQRVLVCLDSNHTHEHVLKELQAYAYMTSVGSYCVVFDTIIDEFKEDRCENRPWGHQNNPKTAVNDFLSDNSDFVVDHLIDNKLLISASPSGYLKRVR